MTARLWRVLDRLGSTGNAAIDWRLTLAGDWEGARAYLQRTPGSADTVINPEGCGRLAVVADLASEYMAIAALPALRSGYAGMQSPPPEIGNAGFVLKRTARSNPLLRSGSASRSGSHDPTPAERGWGQGGQGGIRTHGELAPTRAFQARPFDHSGTCP